MFRAEYLLAERQQFLLQFYILLHVLRWHKPGTVWAIDFFDAPLPVDGIFPYVFVVRDLASGNQLLALPVEDKELARAADALTAFDESAGDSTAAGAAGGRASGVLDGHN